MSPDTPIADVCCPRCHRSLTPVQIKAIWSAFSRAKAKSLGRLGGWPKGKARGVTPSSPPVQLHLPLLFAKKRD